MAYIPIEISFQLEHKVLLNSWLFWFFLLLWLLFYPNAAYILTDLFHLALLNPYNSVTGLLRNSTWMWINFLLLVVSALVSAWVGFKTMFNVVNLIMHKLKLKASTIKFTIIFIITVLNAIGIFIGRFLRIHTVYLFLSPRLFIRPLISMWSPKMLMFTLIMTLVQLVCYWLIWLTQTKNKNDVD